MNKKLEYAYDKMNRCCVSAQRMFSIAGFDMEYEEWFEIMLDSFEEGKDYIRHHTDVILVGNGFHYKCVQPAVFFSFLNHFEDSIVISFAHDRVAG